jgi:hypothetical protein
MIGKPGKTFKRTMQSFFGLIVSSKGLGLSSVEDSTVLNLLQMQGGGGREDIEAGDTQGY